LDDDDVVFVEVFALVNEFHGRLQKGFFYKIKTIACNCAQFISPHGLLSGRRALV
jgi:hypothetical protein